MHHLNQEYGVTRGVKGLGRGGVMAKKRPTRDLEGTFFRTDWPVDLEAQVAKANKAIDKVTDLAFRANIQPSIDAWLVDKITLSELQTHKKAARAQARATHPQASALDKSTSDYEDVLEHLDKTEGAVSRCARRIAGESNVEDSDDD